MLGVGLHSLCLESRSAEVLRCEFLRVFLAKKLCERLPDPLLVLDACRRMPPVQAIELYAYSIALSALEERVVCVAHLLKRVQTPCQALAHETKDGGEVIRENNTGKPRTVDEPCGLENLLVLGFPQVVSREFIRIMPCAAFIDVKEFARDILRSKSVLCSRSIQELR